MAKSKVAPIKKLTIPQLELQAAVLGIRLANTIKKLVAFEIHETRYLSDSTVTLAWICSRTYKFKTFVAARIGEILEMSTRREWFHVGTKENVADDATKWKDPTMGDNNTRWFKGPEFLRSPMDTWPIKVSSRCEDEETSNLRFSVMIHKNVIEAEPQLKTIDEIAPKFQSKWTSLVRVVAFMLRVKDKAGKHFHYQHFVSPVEFQRAENKVFEKIQRESFSEELETLKTPGNVQVKKSSRLWKLSPFLHEGLIRMSSRSQNAQISYAAKNPVILPSRHPLVELMVSHYHERNFHMGEELTISDIRCHAWIIDIRRTVRHITRNCQRCKNQRAKPEMPVMAPLPIQRVDFDVKPFTHVGVDAFGPFNIRFGRGSVKRYGLIFTCLTFRAVHLEVLFDMTTENCLMAIRRFLVRRGWCAHFYSDNGKNFVGANNVLHNELKSLSNTLGEDVAKAFNIEWRFQPAYSPWWGGAWERLIQTIKRCMDFCLNEETPKDEVFQNALIEAEFWMNRRPLTHVPVDHEDAPPLTPNSVLFGDDQDNLAARIGMFSVDDRLSIKASKRAQHLASKFLSRWVKEYLPSINRREKWHENKKPLEVGNVVILTDPSQPKSAWKKGRITKVYPSADGQIRAADVQLADKSIKKFRSTGNIAVLDVESFSAPGRKTGPGLSSGDSTTN